MSRLSKTTTARLLNTLVSLRWVARAPDGVRYRLGNKLFELGSHFLAQVDLRRYALPYLVEIVEKTGDTAYLCVVDQGEALCLACVDGQQEIRLLRLRLGGRLPLNCGAAPMALLSWMDDEEILEIARTKGLPRLTENTIQDIDHLMGAVQEIRRQGYVLSWEDVTIGVASVGVPVRDHTGEVIAAMSVGAIVQRLCPERQRQVADLLLATAHSLSRDLGYAPVE